MFFKSIEPMLGSDALNLILTADKGLITVTVIPSGENNAVNQPISLTASAEELDVGFADAIAGYQQKRSSLAEQLDQAMAVMEQNVTEVSVKAASPKPVSAAKASRPATTDASDPDNDADDSNVAQSTPTQPKKSDDLLGGLFDDQEEA